MTGFHRQTRPIGLKACGFISGLSWSQGMGGEIPTVFPICQGRNPGGEGAFTARGGGRQRGQGHEGHLHIPKLSPNPSKCMSLETPFTGISYSRTRGKPASRTRRTSSLCGRPRREQGLPVCPWVQAPFSSIRKENTKRIARPLSGRCVFG